MHRTALVSAALDPLIPFTKTMRDLTGESRSSTWRRLQRGEVAAIRIGGRWKIRTSEFKRLVERIERGDI